MVWLEDLSSLSVHKCMRVMTEAKPGGKGTVKRVGSGGGGSSGTGQLLLWRIAMGQVRAGGEGASDGSKGQSLPLICWWPSSRHDM